MAVKCPHGRRHKLRRQSRQPDHTAGRRLQRITFHIIGNIPHNQLRHDADAKTTCHHGGCGQVVHHMKIRGNVQAVFLHVILNIRICRFPLYNKIHLCHFLHGDRIAAAGFTVILRNYTDQRIFVEDFQFQITGTGSGEKSEIHNSVLDPVGDIVIGSLENFNADGRVLLPEGLNDLRHKGGTGAGKASHLNGSLLHAVKFRHHLLQAFVAVQYGIHIGQQMFPVIRQCHAGAAPCQYAEAQLLFHG